MVVQNLRTTKGNSLGPVGNEAGVFKGSSEVQGVFGMPQRDLTESDINLAYRHQQSLKNNSQIPKIGGAHGNDGIQSMHGNASAVVRLIPQNNGQGS